MKDAWKALFASRKFWLVVVCLIVTAVFVALGKIEADNALDYVVVLVGGLAVLIGVEDAASKRATGSSSRPSGNPPAGS